MRQPALLLHDQTIAPSTYDKEAIAQWLSEHRWGLCCDKKEDKKEDKRAHVRANRTCKTLKVGCAVVV